tara:strand:- start:52 stop:240 length:189 start_codon:yes stop_codon:yes gene_type:complete
MPKNKDRNTTMMSRIAKIKMKFFLAKCIYSSLALFTVKFFNQFKPILIKACIVLQIAEVLFF